MARLADSLNDPSLPARARKTLINWIVLPVVVTSFCYFAFTHSVGLDIARKAETAKPNTLSGSISLPWPRNAIYKMKSGAKDYRIRCDIKKRGNYCLDVEKYPEFRTVEVFPYAGALIILSATDREGRVVLERKTQIRHLQNYAAMLQEQNDSNIALKIGVLLGIAVAACRQMIYNRANKLRSISNQAMNTTLTKARRPSL